MIVQPLEAQFPRRSRWHAGGYLLAHGLLLLAVVTLSRPEQQRPTARQPLDRSRSTDVLWGYDVLLGAVCAMVFLAFCLLQGSDPGFLTEDLLRNHVLERLDDENQDGAKLEEGDSDSNKLLYTNGDSKFSGELAREKRYRRERVRQIEAALRAEGGTPEDDEQGLLQESHDNASLTQIELDNLEGQDTKYSEFCSDCNIFPPLRSHHCRSCGRCVATFDHHCFVLDTCIGEQNHCRFWWFLLLQSMELAVAIHHNMMSFHPEQDGVSWLHINSAVILVAVLLWSLFLLVFGLWCYHTFLALTNSTTFEFAQGPSHILYLHGFSECDIPFSGGVCQNLRDFGCVFGGEWSPIHWRLPKQFDRDAPQICGHFWENKYYSCC